MGKPKRIVIVEDDLGYVDVLDRVFDEVDGLSLIRSYRDPTRFLAALPRLRPDLVLLDINLPKLSGIQCAAEIRGICQDCRIVMLTVFRDDRSVLEAFLNGADGYLVKDSSRAQIIEGVCEALRGGAPMSSSIARKVVRLLSKLGGRESVGTKRGALPDLLSPRELEVLHLLADGKKYQEIADRLFVSYETIKTHIHHIYEKLKVRNKAEAISKFLSE